MKLIPNAVKGAVGRQTLKLDHASPKLLFAAGVGGMVMSTVLACRATLQLEKVLETAHGDLETANSLRHFREDNPSFTGAEYSQMDKNRDVAIIYTRSVVSVAKLYAPAVLVGAASIGCLTKSHNLLQQRNLALTAAYAAVEEAFSAYRDRVVEKYGAEQDEEFRYSTEVVEYVQDNGKISQETRVGPDANSMYARFFDQTSPSWSKDPEYNNVFLICQQNWANDMLKARGHLFLNEVYDALGMTHTRAGSVVGWVIAKGEGDNYVDFGIFRGGSQVARDFVNGREGSILLDFNVDGVIYDKIEDHGEAIKWQR